MRDARTARNVVCSAQHDFVTAEKSVWNRRNVLAAAFVAFTMPVNAEDVLKIPESERIKPPTGNVLAVCYYTFRNSVPTLHLLHRCVLLLRSVHNISVSLENYDIRI